MSKEILLILLSKKSSFKVVYFSYSISNNENKLRFKERIAQLVTEDEKTKKRIKTLLNLIKSD